MFKLLKKMGKYWWLCAAMFITICAQVVADFFLPFFLGEIIGSLQHTPIVMEDVFYSAIWMILIAAISGGASLLTCKLSSIVTAHLIAATRYDLFKKIESFSTTEMGRFSVSSLVTRTTNDLTLISNAYHLCFRFLLYGPLIAIAALTFMAIEGIWPLTVTICVALVLMIIFIIILAAVAIPKYQAIQGKLDRVTTVTRENLEGLRVVRAYNAEDFQEKKFDGVNNELRKTESFANRALGYLVPGIQLIVGALNVGIYMVSSNLIKDGVFQYSGLSTAVQFAALILMGFIMITVVVVQLPRAIVCAKRVNEVLATEPVVKDPENPKHGTEVGTIKFENVTFAYPGGGEPVLKNISFEVKKGETIAFIGATGAGKSTLINLMPRFFDAVEGNVYVDGLNVKEYKQSELISKFGYVPQRGYLFHDTLKNNITIGKLDANPAQIQRALEISQASEFVQKLPGKLDYEISQGGKNVSGGQRQRLCIARAIIMEPEIFIFDDSFSALDYRTDKILRGEIKDKCKGTTNVIVAQRVGTILDADKIIVLDGGNMVGMGTHSELLRNCSVYKEIALSQLSAEELEAGLKGAK